MSGNSQWPKPLPAAEILLGLSSSVSLSPSPQNGLFGALATPPPKNFLGLLGETYRRRNEWNDRFAHWERPASLTEEGTIDRAERNVRRAIDGNLWLNDQDVIIRPQGSYHNNTNVRVEADIDLRAEHPAVKVEYHHNVVQDAARGALGYSGLGLTEGQVFAQMRTELMADLARKFGYLNVVLGKKAIRIKGITGSRAEVDVVPAIQYHYVLWNELQARYDVLEGVAILSTDGRWTVNFPEQHNTNGVVKNNRTARRFKRIVRIFKRLRADMQTRGIFLTGIPSFLIECLVYAVEDGYFLVDSDDTYDRVLHVARRMKELLCPATIQALTEINEIRSLFHHSQPWRPETATAFVNAAIAHLGEG